MKIVAMSPNGVVETPAGEVDAAARMVVEELNERMSATPGVSDSPTTGSDLDQQTRDGLRRLVKLVRKQKGAGGQELKLRRALEAYRQRANNLHPQIMIGTNFDFIG